MEEIRRQEVRQLALLTARLDPTQQIFFQAEYSLHRRNPTTALLLCVLLGDFGAHYFYFGRYRAGILRLLFCWTLVPAILALFDARTMTARARRYNASLANELVLALQGAVDDQARVAAGIVESAQQPQAMAVPGRRAALAAPISTPEMEAIAAAAWVEREPLQDDPRDPPIPLDTLDGMESAAAHASQWPNALARPVAPEPYAPAPNDQHDTGSEDNVPVWPAPDAWLDEAWAYPALLDERADHPFTEEVVAPEGSWAAAGERDAMPMLAASETAAAVTASDEPFDWPADASIALEGHAVAASDAAATEREPVEPVMLYQVAPTPRRESVHLGPPLPAAYLRNDDLAADASHDPRLTSMASAADGKPGKPQRAGRDQATLAALGSVLASGLAELLRERPSTRPITRPVTRPIAPPTPQPTIPMAPPPEPPALVDEEAATPDLRDQAPLAAETAALQAHATDTSYSAAPLAAVPLDRPLEAATQSYDENWLLNLMPTTQPLHRAPAPRDTAPVPASATAPLPANPGPVPARVPVSLNLRRRVVQRVIVRKMAVLDGRIVAEATIERQVPVVHDEAEMAARIRMATRDAAREALGYLLLQAPEEARPSIREQLDAMRQPEA